MPLTEIGYLVFPGGLSAPVLRATKIDERYFLEAHLSPDQVGKVTKPVKIYLPDGTLCYEDAADIRWDYGTKPAGSTWTISYDVPSLRKTDA